MAKVLAKYKMVPEELSYPNEDDYLIGIFDKKLIPKHKQYSRLFKT